MCSTELVFSDDEIAVLSKIPEMAKKIKEGNSEKICDRQPLIGAFEKFMTFIQSSYEEDGSEGNQNFLIDKRSYTTLFLQVQIKNIPFYSFALQTKKLKTKYLLYFFV